VSEAVLYLVRHGRTELNAAGLLRGHLDVPLDETGEQEAKLVAELFADLQALQIFASPLRRATATARSIAEANGSDVEIDTAFVDRDYGPWSGRARAEVEARFGSVDRAPGVEPRGSMTSRALFEARELTLLHTPRPVMIVAHEVINQAVLARLAANTPNDPDDIPQRTGCWNRIERSEQEWVASVIDAVPSDGRRP
jgi:broad specificity phosphatase PhoE